jgi:hypothetical protein
MVECCVFFAVRTELLNINYTSFHIIFLPDRWQVVSVHPAGAAIFRLDTGFLGFPLSFNKC